MKFSIIMPSYNHACFLEETLEGVLAQTYTNWELLILDDKSSDDSLSIIETYAKRDERIKSLPNSENLGTYRTQNRGLDYATGDFAAILNSDDAWAPKKLELQAKLLSEHPDSVFSYTRCLLIDRDSQPLPEQNHHRDYPTEEYQNVLPWLLHVNQIAASSLVFKLGTVRFQEAYGYSGDWIASIMLARQSMACFVNEPVTFWRQHGDNSSKKLTKTLAEEIAVRHWILEKGSTWLSTLPESLRGIGKEKMDWSRLDLAAHYYLVGDKKSAINTCLAAKSSSYEIVRKVAIRRLMFMKFLPRPIVLQRFAPGVPDPNGLNTKVEVLGIHE